MFALRDYLAPIVLAREGRGRNSGSVYLSVYFKPEASSILGGISCRTIS